MRWLCVALVLGACAKPGGTTTFGVGVGVNCRRFPLKPDPVTLSVAPVTLAGEYRITAIVEQGEFPGRMRQGKLSIWQSRNGSIVAATNLSMYGLRAPLVGSLSSRYDSQPGLTLRGRSFEMALTTEASTLTAFAIDTVTRDGFAGHWASRSSIFVELRDGREVVDAAGHFCAWRDPNGTPFELDA